MKFEIIFELLNNIEEMLCKAISPLWWEDHDEVEAYFRVLTEKSFVLQGVMQAFVESFKDEMNRGHFEKDWKKRCDALFVIIALEMKSDVQTAKNIHPEVDVPELSEAVYKKIVEGWLLGKSDLFKAFIPE